jgi:hypothetical protein
MVDFKKLKNKKADLVKTKTAFTKDNLIPLLELFVLMRFPQLPKHLIEARFDAKGFVWIQVTNFEGDQVTKEALQEELQKLEKEINHYAGSKKDK